MTAIAKATQTEKPLVESSSSFRSISYVFQLIGIPPIWIYMFLTRSTVRKYKLNIPKDAQVMIVANHVSKLDPFILTAALGRDVFKLIPFRYMAANKYLGIWTHAVFMYPFGSFPAYRHHYYTYGLEAAKTIMSSGQTMVIFPEGRISKNRENEPRRGVSVLANEVNPYIVPIKLTKKKFGYNVVIGSAFQGPKMNSKQILDKVYKL